MYLSLPLSWFVCAKRPWVLITIRPPAVLQLSSLWIIFMVLSADMWVNTDPTQMRSYFAGAVSASILLPEIQVLARNSLRQNIMSWSLRSHALRVAVGNAARSHL